MQMEQPQQRRRRQKQQPHRSCARCGSDDTKFCYFNNYSTSQPRYYCKTCKRYWTHGGALRNIPEGSGCTRRKKAKKNAEPSPPSPVFAASVSAILKHPTCAGMTMPQLYRHHYGGAGGFAWGFRSNPAAAMLMIPPGGGGGWPPNHYQQMNHSCAIAAAPPPPPPASNNKIINGGESSEGGMSDWEIDEILHAVLPSSFTQ